ncbi:STAS domain-containing protein [Amycolatopsis sp. NPDC005003]
MAQNSSSGRTFSGVVAVPFEARIVQDEPGVVTVAVSGELDLATSPELRKTVREVLAARPWRLTVDLTAVTFCGSTGLRTLLLLHAAAGEAGTRLHLRPTAAITRLLRITCLDNALPVLEPAPRKKPN